MLPKKALRPAKSEDRAMNQLSQAHYYDPNRLIDALSDWLGITGDAMLSRALKISPQVLKKLRTGRIPLRPSILVSMADCAGRSIDELRCVLGERRRKARMTIAIGAEARHGNN
ncbi:MAG TPA: hypothetical protein VJ698_24260 [Noviherbaspirillum sp.]|nr:hypothetical protein [Noviherbaspirillum sp.]